MTILDLLQKVTSHKYARGNISYTMIYVQAAIFGPLRKNEEEEERPYYGHYKKKKEKKSGYLFKSPSGAPLLDSTTFLRCTPAIVSLEDAEIGGHLKLVRHSRERKF